MSKTNIEWTQRVWNYLTGCSKISAGCKFCYMFVLAVRLRAMGQEKYRNGTKLTVHEHIISNPYTWRKPSITFVNSMSDSYHEDVPLSIHKEARKVQCENPQHLFLDLTKRIENVLEIQDELEWPTNLWLGVSVEDERVLHRVDELRKSNAKFKWISAEPLIGPLTNLNLDGIDWVVVGGEAGNRKDLRPIEESWVIEIMEKCREKGVPFFFKQWGKKAFNPNPDDLTQIKGHPEYAKGGCQLQGKIYREFPESFKTILNQTKMKEIKTNTANTTKLIEPKVHYEIIVNGKLIPIEVSKAIMPLIELYLEKKPKTSNNEKKEIDNNQIQNLSPFKLLLAKAILAGENPKELATRIAIERKIPRPTAQAYVTMVLKHINK